VAPTGQLKASFHAQSPDTGRGVYASSWRANRDADVVRSFLGFCLRGPEGQVLRRVLWCVLRHILRRVFHVPVLHVPPKGSVGGGMLVLGMCSAAER